MKKEIVNRVAQSTIVSIDLEDRYPKNLRKTLDISKWLYQGEVLREKEFRTHLSTHDWAQYKDAFVAVLPMTDAIVPLWSYLLVATHLQGLAQKVVLGDLEYLENVIFRDIISEMTISEFKNKPIIIKGCSNNVPQDAFVVLIQKLLPVAKSIMYGEACSSVPLHKRTFKT